MSQVYNIETIKLVKPFFLSALIGVLSTAAQSPAQPNVLFIAVDDLRPELGCYGVDYIQTPRIDAFAKTGRLFRNHYVTAPSCGPSRYALLTGLSPKVNHDTTNHAFKQNLEFTAQRSIESFPHMFKEAGYETLSIGKICHGKQDTLPRSWSRILSPRRNHPEFQNNSGKTQRPAVRGLDLPDAAYQDGAMTDTVIETLRTLGDEPFFFAVGFTKPHLPFWAPKKYFNLYDAESIPQAEWGKKPESPSYHPSFELMQQYGHHPEAGLEDSAYRRHLKHGYAACVSFVDAQIGRILDALEKSGLADDTYVFYSSDHGLGVGHHGLLGKQNLYEHSTRVPFIVQGPGIPKGKQIEAPIYLQDVMATSLALAEVDKPKHVEFQDVLPLARGDTKKSPYKEIYGAYLSAQRSITVKDVKLIAYPDVPIMRVYDLAKDPFEEKDLAATPEGKETIGKLFPRLLKLQKKMGDKLDLRKSFPVHF